MGIFDYFKKKIKSKTEKVETPNELKHLISEDDFNSILTTVLTYLKDNGHSNISYVDGIIVSQILNKGISRNQINLVNFVKSVLCEERQVWQIKTKEFLDDLLQGEELEHEILADFERAKEFLTVRLQSITSYQDEPYKSNLKELVFKVDIPETYSLLALDLPTRFHILTIKEIKEWGLDKETLFEISHNNLLQNIESILVQNHEWDGAVFYTLFDRNYSASYCIDFANNCDSLIGKKGSLVSFPSKGSVFVHPVTDIMQFNVGYKYIVDKTNTFFNDEWGPISRNIYWFYKNKFILFQITSNNSELTYNIPQQLLDLLYE